MFFKINKLDFFFNFGLVNLEYLYNEKFVDLVVLLIINIIIVLLLFRKWLFVKGFCLLVVLLIEEKCCVVLIMYDYGNIFLFNIFVCLLIYN